jgi:hypothetical protein
MYINDDAIINEAQTMWHEHVRLEAALADNARRIDVTLQMIERGCKIASKAFSEERIKSAVAWGKRIERWQLSFEKHVGLEQELSAEFYAIDTRAALLPCQCMFCTCTCDSDAYGVACPIHN